MPEDRGWMSGAPPHGERLVTLERWQDGPENRWSFQHVRELVPTARISRGDGPASRLARDERELTRVRVRSRDREWSVAEVLESTHTDGFLVVHDGAVVMEYYDNYMGPGSTHLLQSVSKSITAAVVGRLVDDGRLALDADLADVVPELAPTSFAGATVQQMLDMRAGTRFNEDYTDPAADVRLFEQVYLWAPRTDPSLPADATAYFATLENDGPHGGPFRYRSILTDVMVWVIERAAGARFAQVVSDELWAPMGAEFDAEVTVDAHGLAMADGGVCAALRDLGRFGQLYLDGGRVDGRRVLPRWWVDDTAAGAPDGAAAFAAHPQASLFSAGAHYRNYWWVPDPAGPFLYAWGIYGQNVIVDGARSTVTVKLSTQPVAADGAAMALTLAAARAIGEALSA